MTLPFIWFERYYDFVIHLIWKEHFVYAIKFMQFKISKIREEQHDRMVGCYSTATPTDTSHPRARCL